ncbi:inorganic phosphate transporter [Pedobacter sp. B4-66]|uniref:inorganic phosphate transporter n=1 Tax=Pedobacter sp. B4-66 TaxID=2817280 RepID=UPI001BDA9E2C|nr:inorganic phosphate transporter [Pedobacter sp. B4-66]
MTILIIVIGLALLFDVINGFHDAANSIATIVGTRVLSPRLAVLWAAFFNFISYLIFKLNVANTIAKDIVHPEIVTMQVLIAGLLAAIIWNLLTWFFGLPSSSSHTLIGGFVGAAIASAGFSAVMYSAVLKIILFIFLAPLIGMLVSIVISVVVTWICRNANRGKVSKHFKKLQLLSAAAFSIGHGANDAQKIMGIIAVALIASGELDKTATIPFWVVISCHTAMGLGTLLGGWRIVKTMGSKITHLKPFEGFSAETSGAITLFSTSILGIPVSTTHTITGAIIGVGAIRRISAVRWGVTIPIVYAWILTIPATGLLATLIHYILTWTVF